ncbi:reductive dehalogenase domain-containing protein [Clostridiaceae bacterium M8S5]|nr:reductive dehalogenase domain-containing protein [Clostridiaceae bacterium M8S5]
MSKIDGRTIMFARMSYEKGSKEYEDYYKNYPEHESIDDQIRLKPHINSEGTATFNNINSPFADAGFMMLSDFQKYVNGPVKKEKTNIKDVDMTSKLKKFCSYLGAVDIGVTKMKPEFFYSFIGRPLKDYGKKVDNNHKYGLVIAVEMDKNMINRAPQLEEMFAVTKGYVDSAIIALWMTYYIKMLGYDARAHIDGNYEVIVPLVAQNAGIGEIGRNGLVISRKYGQRIRMSVVTTDMPLIADEPSDFGVKKFCKLCNKCSKTCPAKAISSEPPIIENGVERWRIKQESCYEIWRSLGTDCGICLATCPFSQGLDLDKLEQIKHSDEMILKLLKEHEEKYGIRNYIREPLNILK